MSIPRIAIQFDGSSRVFHGGETLSGKYWLASVPADDIRAVECSVLWFTEGKGDEDLAVHHFRRFSTEEDETFNPRRPTRFSTVLPHSPLTYEGVIVKVRWCVRVRVFLTRGRDVVGQKTFRLGSIPSPKMPRASDG